jgi:hypothetical protein
LLLEGQVAVAQGVHLSLEEEGLAFEGGCPVVVELEEGAVLGRLLHAEGVVLVPGLFLHV